MHVLLTRPKHDAAMLRSRIEALGCRVSLAPLLEIKTQKIKPDALIGAAAIVATSRNGLAALDQPDVLEVARMLPVFTVGPGTAQLAKDLGFARVIAGPGTAADLVSVITRHEIAASGRFVQLTGDHLSYDLAGALRPHGVTLAAIPAYLSVAAETLPGATVSALGAHAIDAVVMMSPRSAATWARLTSALRLQPALTDVIHICLSDAVAAALSDIPGAKTLIAEKPNADAIVTAVYRLAGTAKTG